MWIKIQISHTNNNLKNILPFLSYNIMQISRRHEVKYVSPLSPNWLEIVRRACNPHITQSTGNISEEQYVSICNKIGKRTRPQIREYFSSTHLN